MHQSSLAVLCLHSRKNTKQAYCFHTSRCHTWGKVLCLLYWIGTGEDAICLAKQRPPRNSRRSMGNNVREYASYSNGLLHSNATTATFASAYIAFQFAMDVTVCVCVCFWECSRVTTFRCFCGWWDVLGICGMEVPLLHHLLYSSIMLRLFVVRYRHLFR